MSGWMDQSTHTTVTRGGGAAWLILARNNGTLNEYEPRGGEIAHIWVFACIRPEADVEITVEADVRKLIQRSVAI